MNLPRITLRVLFCLLLWQAWLAALPARAAEPLRIGLTPAFLNERHALMADWREYLQRKTGRAVTFVLRDSYEAMLDLMHQQKLDVAWLCDCAHVAGNPEFRLLAAPMFHGRPYYRAYLIVPSSDTATRGIATLRGKVFAYTDPYSYIGFLAPRYEIKRLGGDPERFFRRTFFTRSHRKAIEAVVVGVADAASVNSYIWETLHAQSPALTGWTRIAARSEDHPFPPFVAHQTVSESDFQALRRALLGMADDEAGRALLRQINLDGFTLPDAEIYRETRRMIRFMEGG